MIGRTKLKVAAATVAVAAVGAGAGLAATNGGGASSSSTAQAGASAARPGPPGRGPTGGFDADLAAAATYLGTTKSRLQAQMRSGRSLGQIAKASGKSVATNSAVA